MTKDTINTPHIGDTNTGWIRRKGVVFHTGSRTGNKEYFIENAEKTGLFLAQDGFKRLFYGDGLAGTMGAMARGAIAGGADVYGVSLDFFYADQGEGLEGSKGSTIVSDMDERMATMRNQTNAAIVMPGSYGTMEEGLEWICSSNTILKPQIILNYKGYWDAFLKFFENTITFGFENEYQRDKIHVATTSGNAMEILHDLDSKPAQQEQAKHSVNNAPKENFITQTKHAIILEPAPLNVLAQIMSQIVGYDVANIPGQTIFKDPDNIIRPVIFNNENAYYTPLQKQLETIFENGFSPEERRQLFHFADCAQDAQLIAEGLDNRSPLTPNFFKRKHAEAQKPVSVDKQKDA